MFFESLFKKISRLLTPFSRNFIDCSSLLVPRLIARLQIQTCRIHSAIDSQSANCALFNPLRFNMSNPQTGPADQDPEDLVMLEADQNAEEDLGANDSSPDYAPSDDESEVEEMPTPRRRAPPNRRAPPSPLAPADRPAPDRPAPAGRRAPRNRRRPRNRPAQVPRHLPAVPPRLDRGPLVNTARGFRNHNRPAVGQVPWGLPINGTYARTVYPANFPQKLRELISLVPIQEGRIGQNIRPLIVETFVTNFTDDTLHIIAAVLSLVPRRTLANFALVIAHVALSLFKIRPQDRIAHDGSDNHSQLLLRQDYWSHVVACLESMRDHQVHTILGLPYTLDSLPHRFLYHTRLSCQGRARSRE